MKLSAPTFVVFLISVILIVVGLLMALGVLSLGSLNLHTYWITFAGGALLTLGCLFKGL
jgi:hypothetical protein